MYLQESANVSAIQIVSRIDWHIFIAFRFLRAYTRAPTADVTGAYLKLRVGELFAKAYCSLREARSYKEHLPLVMSDIRKICLIRFDLLLCRPTICAVHSSHYITIIWLDTNNWLVTITLMIHFYFAKTMLYSIKLRQNINMHGLLETAAYINTSYAVPWWYIIRGLALTGN